MLTGPEPLSQLAPHPGITGLAIGVFDGIHLGHQAVIHSLHENWAALTFEPHPLAVIAPGRAPPRLTTLGQKLVLLRQHGAVAVIAVKFDDDLRRLSPAQFVGEIARVFPELRHAAIGQNWSFGRNREGNAARLAELADGRHITVKIIPAVELDGEPVSSTRIRGAISQRLFAEAARLLGRSYAVTGTVVEGDARGRLLGFPTANLADVEQLLPPRGVYAARVRMGENEAIHQAVLNLGRRPTFTSNGVDSLEVHLLDFHGDLYGEELEISHFSFLREEMIFAGPDALKAQIAADIAKARVILAR
ncbi:MAG TPA: riboflavin biosynthesis protein RibF [Candidatus Methylacidiphilales bacterium]|nr:riboflavin biosynthesis protein RibF [Candidatus Methylacidiphilales bacterium]